MATLEERQFEYNVFLSYNRHERHAGSFLPQYLHDILNLKGIKSYKYGEDLEEVEEMAPAVDKAIRGSRIAVVILLTHYASSKSCLSDLVKILEQNRLNGRRVMPLFYGVEPTWVRRQTGMVRHESRYGSGSDKVKLWRKALEEVGDMRMDSFRKSRRSRVRSRSCSGDRNGAMAPESADRPKPNLRRAIVIGILIVFAVLLCSPSIIVVLTRPRLFPSYAKIGIFSTNVAMCLIIAAIIYHRLT